MNNKRLIQTLESGRVRADIELSENGGRWFYDTRIYRPFDADGEEAKAYTFGYRDIDDVVAVSEKARAVIEEQLDNQETVELGQEEAA